MVRVSIAIPCYNNPEDMKRLLDSIRIQDYHDYEVVISDDSTNADDAERIASMADGLAAALARRSASNHPADHPADKQPSDNHSADKDPSDTPTAAANDCSADMFPKVHYTHNSKPLGHVHNWNAAIRQTTGEYIKIMFSDDWFSTDHSLTGYVRMLDEHPEAGLAFSGNTQYYLDHPEKNYDRAADADYLGQLQADFRTLFLSNQIGAPSTTIYRRSLIARTAQTGQESQPQALQPNNSRQLSSPAILSSNPSAPSQEEPHMKQPDSAMAGDTAPTLFAPRSGFASDVFLYMAILSQNPHFVSTSKPLVSIGLHSRQYTETFSETDERIYADYRLLYQEYHLNDDPAMQQYFTRRYIIPFHKGQDECRALGIPVSIYRRERAAALRQSAADFLHHHLG